jgi:hypothetical protein
MIGVECACEKTTEDASFPDCCITNEDEFESVIKRHITIISFVVLFYKTNQIIVTKLQTFLQETGHFLFGHLKFLAQQFDFTCLLANLPITFIAFFHQQLVLIKR